MTRGAEFPPCQERASHQSASCVNCWTLAGFPVGVRVLISLIFVVADRWSCWSPRLLAWCDPVVFLVHPEREVVAGNWAWQEPAGERRRGINQSGGLSRFSPAPW